VWAAVQVDLSEACMFPHSGSDGSF
jgi:hypothetical protein